MTYQEELQRIKNAIRAAFDAVREKGVDVPEGSRVDDLAGLIRKIGDDNGNNGGN